MTYSERLAECLKAKTGLEELVTEGLALDRGPFLGEFLGVLTKSQGQPRLNLMGALCTDGGADLLPIFKLVIQKEGNLLFSKSLILMLAHFSTVDTVALLKELMANFHPDLKIAANRVISKINSQFRDQFYMEEFEEGLKNPKRQRNAIEHMIAEPTPQYIPFLNKMLHSETLAYREPTLEVLAKIGDATSIEPLLGLMENLIKEGERTDQLCSFLLAPSTRKIQSLNAFLDVLASMGNWESSLVQSLMSEILRKKVETAQAWVRFSFGPFSPLLGDQIQKYMELVLLSGEISKVPKDGLVQAINSARETRLEAIAGVARILGRIGKAYGINEMELQLEAIFPKGYPYRTKLMVAFGSVYRSKASLQHLIDCLKSEKDPGTLTELLASLAQFEFEEQPPRLHELCTHEAASLRSQALALLAKCRVSEGQIQKLLQHPNPEVVKDVVNQVAADGLEVGYGPLLNLLSPNSESSVFHAALEALTAFPRGQTGQAVFPWFLFSNPYATRQVALVTLIKAGGPQRLSLIFKGLDEYPGDKRDEMIATVLSQLLQLSPDQLPRETLLLPVAWQTLLCHKSSKFRDQVLTLLERVDWEKSCDEGWLSVIAFLATGGGVARPDFERRRIAAISDRARARLLEGGRARDIDMRFREELVHLMDQVETGTHFEKVSALRKINVIYKEEVVEPQDKSRLIFQIEKYFRESEGDLQGLKLAISISAKIGEEGLLNELTRFMEHSDPELARFARTAYHVALKSGGIIWEVRSIIILDSQLMVNALAKTLSQVGYKVEKFTAPGEALQALQKHAYDLLMVSYRLGDVTGSQFLREARHQRIAPERVLMLTSSRDPNELKDMTSAGATCILQKPFPMEELFLKIKELGYGGEETPEDVE